MDREPYATGAVAASEAVRQGWKLWNADLPDACVAEHFREPWRCYFGHRLYKTLKGKLQLSSISFHLVLTNRKLIF